MLKKANSFIFYCFYSIVFFNKNDNPINRACFGMAMFYTILLLTIIFSSLIGLEYFNMSPFIPSILSLVPPGLVYFKLKNIFLVKFTQIQSEFEGLTSKKNYVFLGLLFFIGPFVLLGVAGYHYSHLKRETTLHYNNNIIHTKHLLQDELQH